MISAQNLGASPTRSFAVHRAAASISSPAKLASAHQAAGRRRRVAFLGEAPAPSFEKGTSSFSLFEMVEREQRDERSAPFSFAVFGGATPRIDAAVPQSLEKTPDLEPSKEEVVSLFAVITGGHLEISRLRLQQSRRQPPPISSLRRRRSSGFSPSSPSPPRDPSPSPATEPSSADADLELL
ncbi:uncharacterized protein A4U43_C05F18620 [Asparagus officinalis]|uniref:Uncharacterized protein n=1 Tax=Asparagus officinalis TaxID=4686 RepID=A0A5P1ESU8_ASPOF|nr:uncharacterized protein A4U43_C05F18620 [Asparagus officinalis]